MELYDIIFFSIFHCIARVVVGQSAWSPSGMLSRVPGLHPVGNAIAVPQFLALNMVGSNSQSECPRVNTHCPLDCQKRDRYGCPECNCNNEHKANGRSCSEPPSNCPKQCRTVDEQGCRFCSCKEETPARSNGMPMIAGSTYKNCYDMIMCMLTCKEGYNLGTEVNSHGCQKCRCIGKDRDNTEVSKAGNNQDNSESFGNDKQSTWGSSVSNNGYGERENNGDKWNGGSSGSGSESTWQNGGGTGSKDPWNNGGTGQDAGSGGGSAVWGVNNGLGTSSAGCSGPLCPGNSGGMNPMYPGQSTGSGSSSSACTGPFCAGGQGSGGMTDGMGGFDGGQSGCTGPFCILGGSSGGMSGTSGGMGGTAGGMGGASSGGGGMMGGPGGVGAFSPFRLAASGGGSSGCNGPFCTMATNSGLGGDTQLMNSATNTQDSGQCRGPSCSARDGQHL